MLDKETQMWRAYSKTRRSLTSETSKRFDRNGNRILMKLSFDEYKTLWKDMWELKGRSSGCYCMSRKDDIGHYEVGNVCIKLHSDNVTEKNKAAVCSKETRLKMSLAHTGLKYNMESFYGRK